MPIFQKVMDRVTQVLRLLVLIPFFVIAAEGTVQEYNAIMILRDEWGINPPSWVGSDPCGDWDGITCTNSRITALTLADMGLKGGLPSDIETLSELQILNLAFNEDLKGQLRASIGNLTKLKTVILDGCRFSGPIPATIGSLKQLSYLSLKNNRFSGPIPPSIGNLANLVFLDLSDNMLGDSIPVSNGTAPGLDMLNKTKHFHFSNNQLSGSIPPQLFSSNMPLIHLIFDRNNFTGSIPSTLGLVKTLEAVRLDRNSLSGPVPTSLRNLTNVSELHLSNNKLTGQVPNLTLMDSLTYVDMSNNTFDASDIPNWFSTLKFLTTLMMENTGLQGQVPQALFSLQNLETVILKNNSLNGTLDIGTNIGNQLNLIDLQKNNIADLAPIDEGSNYTLILVDNPICEGSQNNMAKNYCNGSPTNSSISTTPSNCAGCSSGQVASPNCKCASPYTRTLVFLFVSFSNLDDINYYKALSNNLTRSLHSKNLPVDSVSLSHPSWSSSYQLEIIIEIFPSGDQVSFNQTESSAITSVLSNQSLEGRPNSFGPYSFLVLYTNSGGSNKGVIIGTAIGGSVLLSLLVLVGLYALHQKKKADESMSTGSILLTGIPNSSAAGPQLKGARLFSFEELKKCTDGFSKANDIGSGGYGQVYKGILPTGQMVAIKRAKRESMQGGVEFNAEVELLSRVHHKNLVGLVGFCFEQGEQILLYEYVPNGDLRDSLSGKSGIRLDWTRRLQVALGVARGLAYLHEHANPTIIHRDIKSNNILLDKDLNAKVADFGLSKSIADSGMDHLSTQVKGTLGYLDPEYYMTQQLTDKSDVYSFGVVMLELITARRPIMQGNYIVRVVQMTMDKSKDLYNLDDILDPFIGLGTELKGVEMFVDLAMSCVEELRDKRPRMGEVVKQIENIIQIAALNAGTNPLSTSASYEEYDCKDSTEDVYSRPFDYSGVFDG
ncbi:leucine-rich repeat receptor protein kinase HPCA1-like isoform X1 [Rosa rugosa]|uniref:leucine-rich repeat receptor protein kinase HPCA1-like isoform X1 n=2 Tax=Rosa rugosa TaxID=74645 RepID=UPI002B4135B9|nr:leucine-rich repeat receptor protein kinase HPCA1-like isoform X1 [Rosa rugosa]